MISPQESDEKLNALFSAPGPVEIWFGVETPHIPTQDELDRELHEITDWLAANAPEPKPELSLTMQAVSGFFQGLIWHIEDQQSWDKLSDDQQRIITLVREIVEHDDSSLAELKDAE